ncbi:MAG TPA: hypothetical protein VLX31_14965 [Streptosporangiaceae bacterium]|nr:hypothetical protein [Streptosporangiaceae bacterium]
MSTRRVRRDRAVLPLLIWSATILAVVGGVLAASRTAQGHDIAIGIERFLLYYAGVFALLALTAAVVVGLAATDRILMTPGSRVAGQVAHRVLSLVALAALATHIVLEIVAHQASVTDAFAPFLAQRRTFYVGLGTLGSDLIVVIVLTSIVRRRFTARPRAWRAMHLTAYLAWLLSIVHGLLAGRTAKPYVDWSYGACAAAVAVALAIRVVAARRGSAQHWPPPVPGRLATPVHGGMAVDGLAVPARRHLAIGEADGDARRWR